MSSFFEEDLLQKLDDLDNSFHSIKSVSDWIIGYRLLAKDIVRVWSQRLSNANIPNILNLLYLANDVIQVGQRDGSEFKDEFLKIFTPTFKFIGNSIKLSDSALFRKFDHVLNVWAERNIFERTIISYWRFRLFKNIGGKYAREHLCFQTAFHELQNAASFDVVAREKISTVPLEIYDVNTISTLKTKEEIDKFKMEVSETSKFVNDYNKRLSSEVEKRNILSKLFKDFGESQTTVYEQKCKRLQECAELLTEMQQIKSQLTHHHNSLPDTNLFPNPSELKPLPTATDLFTSKKKD